MRRAASLSLLIALFSFPVLSAGAAELDTQTAYDVVNGSQTCAYLGGETIVGVSYPTAPCGTAAKVENPAPQVTNVRDGRRPRVAGHALLLVAPRAVELTSPNSSAAAECLSYRMTPIKAVANPTAPGHPLLVVSAPVPAINDRDCGIPPIYRRQA